MSHDWIAGLILGLTLGLPVGVTLTLALRPVDRWLDVHWRR